MKSILFLEKKKQKEGFRTIIGLDEAGRGPLAGPVVATAVFIEDCIKFYRDFPDIKDSKRMTEKKREEVFNKLKKYQGLKSEIGVISKTEIEKTNILKATKKAMKKATNRLQIKINKKIDCLLIDGNFKIMFIKEEVPIIKGDEKIISCMVAGIIAKVERDKIMRKLHLRFPQYGFNSNKGYGTPAHFSAIRKYGTCSAHRKTFIHL